MSGTVKSNEKCGICNCELKRYELYVMISRWHPNAQERKKLDKEKRPAHFACIVKDGMTPRGPPGGIMDHE